MREFEKKGSFRLVLGFAAMLAGAAYGCGAESSGSSSDLSPDEQALASPEGALDADDSGQPLKVSEAARAEAERVVSQYTDLQVSRDEHGASVEFRDARGMLHTYDFDFGDNAEAIPEDPAPTAQGDIGTQRFAYQSEWHWWGVKYRLNRGETRDLVTEGNNAAVLYAIGAAFGCGACAVGAAIEANWAGQANRMYNEGDCIHINLPYFTTGRTKINTYNCRN
jgi:hypothetical protein